MPANFLRSHRLRRSIIALFSGGHWQTISRYEQIIAKELTCNVITYSHLEVEYFHLTQHSF